MHIPDETPDVCPACDDAYESVSRHAEGFVVNLLDNERYRRVCFYPTETEDGDAVFDCYHHTHVQATGVDAVPASEPDTPEEAGPTTPATDG